MRVNLPFGQGQAVRTKSLAAGCEFGRPVGRLNLFGGILAGRSQFEYHKGGVPVPHTFYLYTYSASNLITADGGLSLDINSRLSLRFDAQVNRSRSRITQSGSIVSIPLSLSVGYRLPSTKHGHPY
jgi:hypothetical protein